MTTQAWSTVLDQSTDAGFQAWATEFAAKMAACGMVQTTDTGQVNTSTMTRPAVINTAAGYQIWKTPSGGLFIKIEYGTGGTQPTIPAIWVTVGTGSNGSGTLTGQTSTRSEIGYSNQAPVSTVTSYQSFMCAKADYFGAAWKIGSTAGGGVNTPRMVIAIGPTVDNTGAETSTGYGFLYNGLQGASGGVLQSVRTASTAATENATTSFCCFVGKPTASADGNGNNQVYTHWMNTPAVSPFIWACTGLTSEIAGATISVAIAGSTPRTYLGLNNAGSGGNTWDAGLTTSPVLSVAILFE